MRGALLLLAPLMGAGAFLAWYLSPFQKARRKAHRELAAETRNAELDRLLAERLGHTLYDPEADPFRKDHREP